MKFSNHLWYLNEKNISIPLFNSDLSDEVKGNLATELLTSKVKPNKAKKAKVQLADVQSLELTSFVTKDSLKFFKIIGEPRNFLNKHPREWPTDPEYAAALSTVSSLKVVNDAAERCVQLMTDYCKILTKDDEQQQYLMRLVHEHRKKYPTVNKADLL